MTSLKRLHILQHKKIYVDNLGEWIEVPVYDQKQLIELVNEINWNDLTVEEYKTLLVQNWPGLSNSVKAKLKNPAVRNELYDVLIHENWGLSPTEGSADGSYYSEVELRNVELWFATKKVKGRQPDVLSLA